VDPSNPGVAELEAFLGAPLSDLPLRTPNMHAEPRDYASWTTADRYLDVLEGMWLAQALKERHFDSWISDLRNMHIEQVCMFCIIFPMFPLEISTPVRIADLYLRDTEMRTICCCVYLDYF
jgi:hypothetical protein